MTAKSNIIVLADTCAIINLEKVELAGRSVSRWLFKQFKVELSKTILDELNRHTSLETHYLKARISRDYDILETKYLAGLQPKGLLKNLIFGVVTDAGERHNYCLAVENVRRGHCQQCIYITDDEKAIRKWVYPESYPFSNEEVGMQKWSENINSIFLLGPVWTSIDLILHLYLTNAGEITYTHAENALTDLIAQYGTSEILPSTATTGSSPKLARKLHFALKRLDTLRTIIH